MSKKETEFERYERMQKLQKEAELSKKKKLGTEIGVNKKKKIKTGGNRKNRNWTREYELGILDEDEYML